MWLNWWQNVHVNFFKVPPNKRKKETDSGSSKNSGSSFACEKCRKKYSKEGKKYSQHIEQTNEKDSLKDLLKKIESNVGISITQYTTICPMNFKQFSAASQSKKGSWLSIFWK